MPFMAVHVFDRDERPAIEAANMVIFMPPNGNDLSALPVGDRIRGSVSGLAAAGCPYRRTSASGFAPPCTGLAGERIIC